MEDTKTDLEFLELDKKIQIQMMNFVGKKDHSGTIKDLFDMREYYCDRDIIELLTECLNSERDPETITYLCSLFRTSHYAKELCFKFACQNKLYDVMTYILIELDQYLINLEFKYFTELLRYCLINKEIKMVEFMINNNAIPKDIQITCSERNN